MADTKNGYEALAHVSQCFSDIQEYVTRLEKEMRELEAANDDIQNENDKLREENERICTELERISGKNAEDVIAELKRDFMTFLETMPAEVIKKNIIDSLFGSLNNDEKPKKINAKDYTDWIFETMDGASEFLKKIKEYTKNYGFLSIIECIEIASEITPKFSCETTTKNYQFDCYGWSDEDLIGKEIEPHFYAVDVDGEALLLKVKVVLPIPHTFMED